YVESASGVAQGGRTGLTSLTVAVLFFLSLFFTPLFTIIPGSATAPVLIIVGLFMVTSIKDLDFEDFTHAVPSFITVIMMPLTWSIADGIVLGMLSHILIKIFAGKAREITPAMYVIGILFAVKMIL
ncbi:MAG: NCS2 family permease, partial [Oligoflexales bacterium]|nr:NCS2 family permease [Oligoflexales bacterium]